MSIKLPIKIDNTEVPTVINPKILGTILDPLLKFNAHSQYVKTRVAQRNNVLKALAGTSWGKDKETILTTYKAIGRSIFSYCAPIWTPSLCDTGWADLQRAQNVALRTATGCLRKTDIGHLHTECKLLKVEQHNVLLAKQFHLATKQTNHVNFSIPFTPPPRIMKPSLATMYEDSISHLFTDNGNSSAQHKIGLNTLHTEAVAASIAQAPPNKVLLRAAPEVNAEEKKLPRSTRVTLAQLRSNYSTKLMSTLHCFNPDTA